DKYPTTPNGKIDKQALLAINNTKAIHTEHNQNSITREEQMLCAIWAEILNLDIDVISVYDDFFNIGGHSLLAMQVVSRINRAFNCDLKLHDLLKHSTIFKLAKKLPKNQKKSPLQIKPTTNKDITSNSYPTTHNQQRIWFLTTLESKMPIYYIAMAYYLNGNLDYNALQNALLEIINRHTILRTKLVIENHQIRQKIIPTQEFDFSLPVIRMTNPSEKDSDSLLYHEGRKPFDLTTGPLIRFSLLKLAEKKHILYFCMHHIINDGWSDNVLNCELCTLYNAYTNNKPTQLKPLPIQYHNFSTWQDRHLTENLIEKQLTYWRKQLGNASALNIPIDYPRPESLTYDGKRVDFKISKNIANKLNQLAAANHTTLFNCMLSAFDILLAKYSGQEDIVLGTTFANRQHWESESLIGLFANTIVLRSNLSHKPTFLTLLQRNKKMITDAYANQDVPFERVVQAVQPLHKRDRNPLFQVMLTFEPVNAKALKLNGLKVNSKRVDLGYSIFDLTLFVQIHDTGLHCTFEYNTNLFMNTTIKLIITNLKALLKHIINNPLQSITDIPTPPQKEHGLIDHTLNQTRTEHIPATKTHISPQTKTEKKLAALWSDLLNIEQVSINDSFFHLGGHSLLTIKLILNINDLFQVDLALSDLFTAPTVKKLAELIDTARQKPAKTEKTASPIIVLQKHSDKTPLFLVHPIGGTVFCYKELANYLSGQSIYALQDPSIEHKTSLFGSLTEMAEYYLKSIQKIQPHGPYLLAGASFGGVVAIEIARQLRAKGEQIKFIGLFDSWAKATKLAAQPPAAPDYFRKLTQHRIELLKNHKIDAIEHQLTLFKAQKTKQKAAENNFWDRYVAKPVTTFLIPGDHESILEEPNVQELAQRLGDALNKSVP
ncbi:MAG: hypothetical protein KAT71_06495, partial [Gammaproteobacteria bacterium]|nr:hypothetical protein [Gammaproteobacteria bacterium]